MFSVMSGQAGQADASVAVVESLLGVVAGRLPFDVAEALLVDALIVYLDGKQVSASKSSWFGWVRFLQRNAARKRISDLDISIDRICHVADGKVSKIYTHKKTIFLSMGQVSPTALFSTLGWYA